jgi:hypothetical protein
VIVGEEVTRHIQHGQCVGGPDAGIRVDVDRQLRLHFVGLRDNRFIGLQLFEFGMAKFIFVFALRDA